MDNKDVAVIVVTYNRKELLIQCIQSILKQTIEKLTVFVVDNNSNDGTQDLFQEKICDDRVRYYNTGLNIGGAGGFNYGMKKAYEEGYEYFWLMDDDSMPSPDALDRIHAASDLLNEDYGFLCSYVKWTDDSPCKMNIPRIDSNWLKSADLMHNNLVAVTSATFVGYFTRKAVVEKVGLPIKEFFIWNDDTNFSLRINQHYKSYIVLDSTITHKMLTNNNASIIKDTSGRYSRYFYAYRNRFYTAKEMGGTGKYILEVIKNTVIILIRSKGKFKKIFYMYKGFLAGVIFNPKIEFIKNID